MLSWTFAQQRALFTQMDVPFYIPWDLVVVVVIVAIISAVLSAGLPAHRMLQKSITHLLRAP